MSNPHHLLDILNAAPDGQTAIIFPEPGSAISYAKLREQVRTMADALAALSIRRGDRVATVLTNGLAEKIGEHKTSMLQDLEARRPMELEAICGSVVELGERLGMPMPHTRTVYAATKLLDRISRGEYPQ